MAGLPEVRRATKRRAWFETMILGGVERLTERLMSGDAVSETDLDDIEEFARRAGALIRALEARKREAGVIE